MAIGRQFVLFAFGTALFAAPVVAAAEDQEPKWFDKIETSIGITTIIQGTSGNNDPADPNSGDNLDYTNSVDIGFEAEVAPGVKGVIALEAGQGGGLTGRVGDSTFRPNYDAYPTQDAGTTAQQDLTVSNAYVELTFLDGVVMLMAGKMDCHSMIDQNEFANSEASQFIGGPFVRTPGWLYLEMGQNGQYYANGFHLHIAPVELLEIALIAANGEDQKAGSGGHVAVQLTLKPKFNEQPGNYRFWMVQDHRDYANVNTGALKAQTVLGVSFDHYLSDDIGFFFRYATQDKNLNAVDSTGAALGTDPLENVMSGGFQFGGGLWNSADDAVGIGYAVGKAKVATFSGDQSMIEVYYRWQVSPNFSLSPDIQLHSNMPRAQKRDITAYALRAQVDF